VSGGQLVGAVRAGDAGPNLNRPLEQRLSARVEAKAGVHAAHHIHHLRLKSRILRQAGLDIVRRPVENLPCRHAAATCFTWISHAEHALHDFGDPIGAIALARRPLELDRLNDRRCSEQEREYHCGRHAPPVPPDVLAKPVSAACRPGQHRLVP
jgi:hypothetical protein